MPFAMYMKQSVVNRVGVVSFLSTSSLSKIALIAAMTVASGSIASKAYALALGASSTMSHIGEPLHVEIPLKDYQSNVAMSANADDRPLVVSVEQRGSADVLLVKSNRAIMEPYYTFSVTVGGQASSNKKTYTVLLDLPDTEPPSADSSVDSAQALVAPQKIRSEVITAIPGSVMGPYDWAEAGKVPEKFGAVLDGQSIWRVARRINKALDVSVEQMAVALYEANPDAFFTTSIDSLKAGSFMTIPSADVAQKYTERQAQARLDSLSSSSSASNPSESLVKAAASPASESLEQTSVTLTNEDVPSKPSSQENSQPDVLAKQAASQFKIDVADNALASLGASQGASGNSNGSQSQSESLSVLSGTINTLVEELIKKDQRIAYLENKVGALEELAKLNVADNKDFDNAPSGSDMAYSVAEGSSGVISDASANSETDFSEMLARELAQPNVTQPSSINWFLWLMLAVLASVFLLRQQIFETWNKFASNFSNDELPNFDDVPTQSYFDQFSASEMSVSTEVGNVKFDSEQFVFNEDDEQSESFIEIVESGSQEAIDIKERDFSKLESMSSKGTDGMVSAHESDLEFDQDDLIDDKPSAIEVKDFAEEEIDDMDIEDLFGLHLANKDFGFLERLLDVSKGDGLSDESYDYLHLRLLKASGKQTEFKEYFASIEERIDQYSDSTRNKIADLLLES